MEYLAEVYIVLLVKIKQTLHASYLFAMQFFLKFKVL